MSQLNYRRYDAQRDESAYCLLIADAFGVDPKIVPDWIAKAGTDNIRIVECNKETAASCMIIPMGQFFGGVSFPMLGIAGVAVRPEYRGQGVAKMMMRSLVEEISLSGAPLSTLFASTMPLYRSVGYELAGQWPQLTLDLQTLPASRLQNCSEMKVRPLRPNDQEAVRQLYRLHAPDTSGMLDRGDYIWSRIFTPRQGGARGYLIEDAQSQLQGYVILRYGDPSPADHRYDLQILDLMAATADASGALLALLSSYRSLAGAITANLPAHHPLFLMLPEQSWKQQTEVHWLVRILNLKGALEQRRYPARSRAQLHLEVDDPLLPVNHGRFTLTVGDGHGELSKGGRGDLRLSIKAVSPLFSGLLSARALEVSGRIEGSPQAIETADALFSSPIPWQPDMF